MYYIKTPLEQVHLFLLNIGFGYASGLLYALLCRRKGKRYKKRRICDVKEFLFFFIFTFTYFSFLLCTDNGCFRLYTFSGMIAGFIIRGYMTDVIFGKYEEFSVKFRSRKNKNNKNL